VFGGESRKKVLLKAQVKGVPPGEQSFLGKESWGIAKAGEHKQLGVRGTDVVNPKSDGGI